MPTLRERIERVKTTVAQAAQAVGRDASSVTLVAVSKGHPGWMVRAAHEHGLTVFGESRVQEAEEKVATLQDLPIAWHLVGRLQKNKVRAAVATFPWIHSVDSLALLERIDRIALELSKVTRVLVQIDLAGESTKTGVPPAVVPELLRRAAPMKNVIVAGFMLLPPYFEQPDKARPYFRKVDTLLQEANAGGWYGDRQLTDLSMGMSHDYAVAITEGATIVRVGTAIFGERTRGQALAG